MSRWIAGRDGEYRRTLFVEQHLTFSDIVDLVAVASDVSDDDLDALTPNELRDRVRDVLAVRGLSAVGTAQPDDAHRALARRAFGAPPVETAPTTGEHL